MKGRYITIDHFIVTNFHCSGNKAKWSDIGNAYNCYRRRGRRCVQQRQRVTVRNTIVGISNQLSSMYVELTSAEACPETEFGRGTWDAPWKCLGWEGTVYYDVFSYFAKRDARVGLACYYQPQPSSMTLQRSGPSFSGNKLMVHSDMIHSLCRPNFSFTF